MNKYLNQNTLLVCLAFLFAIHMVTFPFIVYPTVVNEGPSWFGLDISWQMTINYARVAGWVWGKDIIYTYGPLGFLATRIGWELPRWLFLAFDAFMVFNFFFIFKDFLKYAKDKWLAVFIVLSITLLVNPLHGSDLSWVITVFAFYWMYKTFDAPKAVYFVLLCVNILICFYLKLNTGLIGTILLAGHLANMYIFKKIKIGYALVVFTGLIVAIVAASYPLHVNLPGYIKGAMEIIKGYNDIMYFETSEFMDIELDVAILFYCFVGFYIIYLISLIKNKNYSHLYFAGIALLYTFLLRKQSIVRNDAGHYIEFFSYSSLVLLSGFFLKPFDKMQKPLTICMIVLTTISLVYLSDRGSRKMDDAVVGRYASQADYIQGYQDYDKTPFLNNRHKRYIPDSLLKKITDKTIDIFPWDSEYLLENKLNYSPRPIFQSFSSYTSYLQDVNYKFYEKYAPQFVIYDYESIDYRYPFNDDLPVNLFICKNYTFADSFVSNGRLRALLQKKEQTQPLQVSMLGTKEFALGQDIPVDTATTMMKIHVDFSASGKFESLYYRTPKMKLKMMMSNGHWQVYQISKEMLESGVFVAHYVASNRDFIKYMNTGSTMYTVKKIRVVAKDHNYKQHIKVDFYNIK